MSKETPVLAEMFQFALLVVAAAADVDSSSNSNSSSGLSTAGIVGIIIGCVVGVVAVILIGLYFLKPFIGNSSSVEFRQTRTSNIQTPMMNFRA